MGWFNGKIDPKLNPTGGDLESPITQAERDEAAKIVIQTSPGYSFPDHYLRKMTRAEINKWTRLFWIYTGSKCPRNKGITTNNCSMTALPLAVIENANLAYINGFTDYAYVEKVYKEAKAFIESMPVDSMNESFKSSLKSTVKGALTMVVGLVTGGPIGLYIGAATAASEQIAKQREKKAAADAAILNPQADKVLQAVQAKSVQDAATAAAQKKQQTQKNLYLYGGIGLIAIAGIYFIVSD
jgi:hypothetical protein